MGDNLTCPKCAGTMEPGVIPAVMTFLPGSWQGNIERGFLEDDAAALGCEKHRRNHVQVHEVRLSGELCPRLR
jgi:hypothetical protein